MRNKTSTNTWLPRLHLTSEQTWWAEHCWDENTMDVLLEAMDRPGLQHVLIEQSLCEKVEHNSRVNMDGMMPSGEWVVKFLQTIGDRVKPGQSQYYSTTPSRFPTWEKYPELSQPVRLYAYYQEELPQVPQAAIKLLLLSATLTDADVDFLLGGVAGAPTGRKTREQVIAGFRQNPAPVRNIHEKEVLRKSPSVYDGFLPREHLYLLMGNHSFADSPRFEEVILEIERWRNEPALKGASFGEELFLFLSVVLNPATNRSSLALIQSLTRKEEEWVRVLEEGAGDYSLSEERQKRLKLSREAALRASLRLDYAHDPSGEHHLDDVAKALVNLLPQHPNWERTSEDFEPQDSNRYRALMDSLTSGFREDIARPGDDEARFRYLRNKTGSSPSFWREARFLYPLVSGVRERAKEVILDPKGYCLTELCSYAHMIGGVIHPISEVKKDLADAGVEIPTDWLLEIIR